MTTTPTSGAADLPEAGCSKHHLIHCSQCRHDNMVRDLRAENDRLHELVAGQATAAKPAVPPNAITASVMRDDGGEAPAFCLMAAYRSEKDAMDAFALIAAAPAQPAAQQSAAYAELPEKYYLAGGEVPTWDAKQMRAFADATQTLRASHGQAPAGTTEPTEQQILEAAEKAGLWPNTVHSWIPAFHRYHKELAKAQPAPAQADSVQEDAADPLQGAANWLAEAHGQFSPVVLSGCLMIGYNRAKRLHDAALAARKQGATP